MVAGTEAHKGGEDGADADADEDETVVRDGKMARADEDHGKSLEYCRTNIIRNLDKVRNEKSTCVNVER
jgi:hypothetical protein